MLPVLRVKSLQVLELNLSKARLESQCKKALIEVIRGDYSPFKKCKIFFHTIEKPFVTGFFEAAAVNPYLEELYLNSINRLYANETTKSLCEMLKGSKSL